MTQYIKIEFKLFFKNLKKFYFDELKYYQTQK